MAIGQMKQTPAKEDMQKTSSVKSVFQQMKKDLSFIDSWELLPSSLDVLSLKFGEYGNSAQASKLLKTLYEY